MRNWVMTAVLAAALGLSGQVVAESARQPARVEPAPNNDAVLDLLREVGALKREVQELRGQVENQGYTIEQLRNQLTSGYTELDRRLQATQSGAAASGALPTLAPPAAAAVAGTPAPESALQVQVESGAPTGAAGESRAAVPGANPGTAPAPDSLEADAPVKMVTPAPGGAAPPPATPAPAATSDDATSEAAYRDAFGLLRAGDYDKAIAAFSTFQTRFPTSQYGDNAQYWLAEAYYAKGQYAEAIPEYQAMLARYPASKKLSHAMLKIGYSLDKQGKTADAKAVLSDLLQKFPGSAAAKLAEERLAQIAKGAAR